MDSPAGELHVLPNEMNGGWTVETDDQNPATPWFATLAEAEHAAQRQAAARGARCIFLHDRYHRVRSIATRRPRA